MSTQNILEKDESGYYEIVTKENLNAIINRTSNDKHKGKSTQIGPGSTSAIKVAEKLPSKSEPYPSEMRGSQVFAPIRDINSDQFSDE